jgi:hypothetical protein
MDEEKRAAISREKGEVSINELLGVVGSVARHNVRSRKGMTAQVPRRP